jgi:hypothetical protein
MVFAAKKLLTAPKTARKSTNFDVTTNLMLKKMANKGI